MKKGSLLLEQLNNDYSCLKKIECSSYFCKWDLMTFPGWKAHLPLGYYEALPVMTRRGLITDSKALDILVKKILSI